MNVKIHVVQSVLCHVVGWYFIATTLLLQYPPHCHLLWWWMSLILTPRTTPQNHQCPRQQQEAHHAPLVPVFQTDPLVVHHPHIPLFDRATPDLASPGMCLAICSVVYCICTPEFSTYMCVWSPLDIVYRYGDHI